jgi:predicted nucleic acid-binding protein
MILCDTNILIEFYKNNEQITETLRQIGGANLAVSVVTVAELYYGALNKTELGQIKEHLSLLRQLSLTSSISQRFLGLMEDYALSHKLSIPDALIAASAMEHEAELFTLNLRDFRFISGLRLYEPA